MISVRMRLGVLHYYIELIQQQLYTVALQSGLMPGVDYFLHDEELPQGVMIETQEEFKLMIQTAIKKLKMNVGANKRQVTLECLHDLGRAYKLWFNPSRLIDAVMVLQQNLISESLEQEPQDEFFLQKMVALYGHLTTTECLDLYGYFTNHDSRYLLYTFYAITQDHMFDWLPLLNDEEKTTATKVFSAMRDTMEALRIELKNRHVLTEPYIYMLVRPGKQIRHRNRDAVCRAITVYKNKNVAFIYTLEQLFQSMEVI